jgi:exo-beta-1,3-glucanase (GH17 family)
VTVTFRITLQGLVSTLQSLFGAKEITVGDKGSPSDGSSRRTSRIGAAATPARFEALPPLPREPAELAESETSM